jgi:hypothetical protein
VSYEPHTLPMTRLFDRRDIEFLRSVPGYTRRGETVFRQRRCWIFREYLASVRAEFTGVIEEIEDRAEDSPGQQELASWQLRCRMQLEAAMIRAYIGLLRYRWSMGSVHLTDVVQRFDAILADLRQWIPQAE